MMNLRHAEYILTVVREGSITAASKALFISQPALSQAIKQAETDLGTPIFDRSTDPISLTLAGRRYAEAAQRMQDIERGLRAEITASATELHGHIRVGISAQRGIQLLPMVVPEFHRQYPYIRLDLVEHGSDTLERLTAAGECDIALVTTSKRSARLRYVLIESEAVVLMAAKTTALAQRIPDGTPIDITQAAGERFVCMTTGHSVRTIENNLFEQFRVAPRILMMSDNMEAAKMVTALSDAVMLIPTVYVSPNLRGLVHCYPVLHNDYQRHFYFCCRREMRITRYMEDFVRIACEKLGVPFSFPGDMSAPTPDLPPLHARPTGE